MAFLDPKIVEAIPREDDFQAFRLMDHLQSHAGSCRRSTKLGLGLKMLQNNKYSKMLRLIINVGGG